MVEITALINSTVNIRSKKNDDGSTSTTSISSPEYEIHDHHSKTNNSLLVPITTTADTSSSSSSLALSGHRHQQRIVHHHDQHPNHVLDSSTNNQTSTRSSYTTVGEERLNFERGCLNRTIENTENPHNSSSSLLVEGEPPSILSARLRLNGSTTPNNNSTPPPHLHHPELPPPQTNSSGCFLPQHYHQEHQGRIRGQGSHALCHVEIPGWIHSPSNITIVMDFARLDRMGNQLARIFKLSLLAHIMQYNFCVGSESGQKYTKELGIPTCPRIGVSKKKRTEKPQCNHSTFPEHANNYATAQLEPGIYHYRTRGMRDDKLNGFIKTDWFVEGARSRQFREFWRTNLLNAPIRGAFANSSIANENLFINKNKTIIAVHVRRGDCTWQSRRDIFVKDIVYIQIIKQLRSLVDSRYDDGILPPEVHLFSEDYGTVNWTSYKGLVDEFHLAPKMSESQHDLHKMDWSLNIRDWVHFQKADITVTGYTFSFYPAHFKDDPDPKIGLPFNVHPCRIGGPYGGCNTLSAFQSGGTLATYTYYTDLHDPNANDSIVVFKNLPTAWE